MSADTRSPWVEAGYHRCEICGNREESPLRLGGDYDVKGDNGRILRFWMCNPCMIASAPPMPRASPHPPRPLNPARTRIKS